MGRKHAKKNGDAAVLVDSEDAALFRGQMETNKRKGDELFAQSQCAPTRPLAAYSTFSPAPRCPPHPPDP